MSAGYLDAFRRWAMNPEGDDRSNWEIERRDARDLVEQHERFQRIVAWYWDNRGPYPTSVDDEVGAGSEATLRSEAASDSGVRAPAPATYEEIAKWLPRDEESTARKKLRGLFEQVEQLTDAPTVTCAAFDSHGAPFETVKLLGDKAAVAAVIGLKEQLEASERERHELLEQARADYRNLNALDGESVRLNRENRQLKEQLQSVEKERDYFRDRLPDFSKVQQDEFARAEGLREQLEAARATMEQREIGYRGALEQLETFRDVIDNELARHLCYTGEGSRAIFWREVDHRLADRERAASSPARTFFGPPGDNWGPAELDSNPAKTPYVYSGDVNDPGPHVSNQDRDPASEPQP